MNNKLEKLLGVFVSKASAELGADYLNNFEGADHQALLHLADGVRVQYERLTSDIDNEEIVQQLKAVADKKADVFKKAAMQIVPLDKEEFILSNKAFGGNESDEDIIADWAKYYPTLGE